MRIIQPIIGEWFRFFAVSDSRPADRHLIDLQPFDWNGECACENFQYNIRKHLRIGKRDEFNEGRYHCKHLTRAWIFFGVMVAPKLYDQLMTHSKQPVTPPRKRYVLR